jgi:hypothetical protein
LQRQRADVAPVGQNLKKGGVLLYRATLRRRAELARALRRSSDGACRHGGALSMDQTDIADYARRLSEAHGERALAEAAQRAAACEKDKDKDGAQTWRRVEAALQEMRGPRTS